MRQLIMNHSSQSSILKISIRISYSHSSFGCFSIFFSKNNDSSLLIIKLIDRICSVWTLLSSKIPSTSVSLDLQRGTYFCVWEHTHYSYLITFSVAFWTKQAGLATNLPGQKQKVLNMLRVGVPKMSTCMSWYFWGSTNLDSRMVLMDRAVSHKKVLLTTPVSLFTAFLQFLLVTQNSSSTSGLNSHISIIAASMRSSSYSALSGTIDTFLTLYTPVLLMISQTRTSNSLMCLASHHAYLEWELILRTWKEGFHCDESPSKFATAGGGFSLSAYWLIVSQSQQVSVILIISLSPFSRMLSNLVSQKQQTSAWQLIWLKKKCFILMVFLSFRLKMQIVSSSGRRTTASLSVGIERLSAYSLKSCLNSRLPFLLKCRRQSWPTAFCATKTTPSSKAGAQQCILRRGSLNLQSTVCSNIITNGAMQVKGRLLFVRSMKQK